MGVIENMAALLSPLDDAGICPWIEFVFGIRRQVLRRLGRWYIPR
jgi:hypothetical protein